MKRARKEGQWEKACIQTSIQVYRAEQSKVIVCWNCDPQSHKISVLHVEYGWVKRASKNVHERNERKYGKVDVCLTGFSARVCLICPHPLSLPHTVSTAASHLTKSSWERPMLMVHYLGWNSYLSELNEPPAQDPTHSHLLFLSAQLRPSFIHFPSKFQPCLIVVMMGRIQAAQDDRQEKGKEQRT